MALVWPKFDPKTDKVVLDILHSGRVNYWTGGYGRKFEQAAAKYLGVKKALSVTNGTVALQLALQALGVGKGDEVIVTPYSFRASATCVIHAGAKPVFADTGVDHMLNAETIAKKITPRTKAIVVVHLYGLVADMDPILKLAKKHRLFVVEDCAQCFGGEYKGRKVGTLGDAGCYSFCQAKHITTGGEGGMVVAKNAKTLENVESLREHGWKVGSEPKVYDKIGYSARLTEIQSAIGYMELKRFKSWNMPRRRRYANIIKAGLKDHPLVKYAPVDTAERKASFWLMPFVLDDKKLKISIADFIEKMQRAGAPVYKIMWPLMAKAPIAAKLIPNTIGFWVHPTYEEKDLKSAIAVFNKMWKKYHV